MRPVGATQGDPRKMKRAGEVAHCKGPGRVPSYGGAESREKVREKHKTEYVRGLEAGAGFANK